MGSVLVAEFFGDMPAPLLDAANRLADINPTSPNLVLWNDFGSGDTTLLDLIIHYNPHRKYDEAMDEGVMGAVWAGLLNAIQHELLLLGVGEP